MSNTAAITGVGVIAPAGIGKEAFWQGVTSAQSFITPITRFDTTKFIGKVAGMVADFNPRQYIDPRIIAQTDRWTHFDLVCAQEAIADAGLDIQKEDPTRIGLVYAAGMGGNEFGQKQLHLCWERGPSHVSVYQSIAWFYAASIGQISITQKIRGYGRNICAETAGSLMALAHAARVITQGICDIVIVGGSEASISPYAFACHQASGLLSSSEDAFPYRPFARTRSGTVVGEGGAAFCVESAEHARRRGAHVYAEIAGRGQSFDRVRTGRSTAVGKEYARAIAQALATARQAPSDIDWIVCDGLGTQEGDIAEAWALSRVFGADLARIPASAPKSMIGRLFNGASTVDVAMALLGLHTGTILPTVGYDQPDPRCPLDCVPHTPRSAQIQQVLIGARGFGGFNGALVLRKW